MKIEISTRDFECLKWLGEEYYSTIEAFANRELHTNETIIELRAQVAALQNIPIPAGCITEGEEMYIPLYSRRAVLEWIKPVIKTLSNYIPRNGSLVDEALAGLTAIKEKLEKGT